MVEDQARTIVGYTSGVYDLFHVGHLNVLRRASQECDRLVVAVTTDELSLAAKGKTPVIPYAERADIVANLRFVDEVVPQTNMNKIDAWERVRFDRMFVGDDWKGTEKWNQLELELGARGVEIVYFPYTTHTSSTLLREALSKLA